MSLPAGHRLGPYEIESLIGAGGMGQVYRARDLRLDRTVAIKVLTAQVDSPASRERFEREARAVSSLNHPNICALYDVGNQDGLSYLVMEYLAGETLAKHLAAGPMPLAEVLEYAVQIAEALDSAHRQGVTHRDLKPGNIILTDSGAKLLDFGLAKLGPNHPWPVGSSDATRSLTSPGGIMGTCQYMAPELLEGKPVDARCDIFAFGAVLYEMITGRRAFHGATQAVIIAAILEHDPPPIAAEEGSTLAALDHVVRACLVKDPEERQQTAHDVLIELRWISGGGVRRGRRWPLGRAAGWLSIATILVLLYLVISRHAPTPDSRQLRASLLPPEQTTFLPSSLPALSPDGRRVVFAAASEGKWQLWLRDLDSLKASPMAGTEYGSNPFWSPDGDAVAFFSQGKLRKVKVSGGPAVVLCDAPRGRGGSWSRNGTIIFSPSTEDPLYRIPADGGQAAQATTLDAALGQVSHRWPWFLPDGHHYLYTGRSADATKNAIYVADLDSKDKTKVLSAGSNAAYAAPGYLVFARERTLMAASFSPSSFRTGEPVALATPVDLITANVQGNFSVSQTGTLVYYSGGAGLNSQLTWFDRAGHSVGAIDEPGSFVQPSISPDGRSLAVDRLDSLSGTYDIWEYDLARGGSTRLTFDPRQDGYPVWSPDGTHIAFASNRAGHYDLFLKTIGSAGQEELLLASPLAKFPSDWSRDGRYLIYYLVDPKTKYDLWIMENPTGPRAQRKTYPYLASEFDEHRAKLSPDGHWLAYTSNETSRDEIYVQSFPTPGNKRKVSVNGGTRPVWRRDGKELFYVAADKKMMATAVKAGDRVETGTPQALFETHLSLTRFFDISPDGKKFLLIDPVAEAAVPMTLLVNWPAAVLNRTTGP